MASNEQFYDVRCLHTGHFILRATLSTVSMIYRWETVAEARILKNGTKPTDMFANGQRSALISKFPNHEDVRVVPVMSDWQPYDMRTHGSEKPEPRIAR